MKTCHMKWSPRFPVVVLVLTAVVWANPCLGWARQVRYSQLPIAAAFKDPKSKTYKDAKALKVRVINGSSQLSDTLPSGSPLAAAGYKTVSDVFDAWYLRNVIPSMTHLDKLGQLAETRTELLDDLSRLSPGPARTALVSNLLKYTWGFANSTSSSKFKPHPALRVNAMLLLGEINQTEESRSGSRRPPVPHAIARRQLLKAWTDGNPPDSLRVAILVGLGRHVKLDRVQPANSKMSADNRNTITSEILTLLKTEEPVGNLSTDGLVWMRRQAMEILADLQLDGAPQEQFTQALTDILTDEKNSLSFRCSAAATLGDVILPESHKPSETAHGLAQLALDATTADLAELDRMIEELQNGGGRGMGAFRGGGGYGDEMFDGGRDMYNEGPMMGEGDFSRDEGYGDEMFGGGDEEYGGRPMARRKQPRNVRPVVRVADERTVPTRRQLLHHLICVRSGLLGDDDRNSGLASAAGTDGSYVNSVASELNELITAAKDVTTDLEDFRLALNTGSEQLAELVGRDAPAAPAAADEAPPVETVAPEEAFQDLPDFEGFE